LFTFFSLFFVIFISVFLFFLLFVLSFFLSLKDFYLLKTISFESGFIRLGKIQNSFSIHFFVMLLIFVIFDLEIVILLAVLISGFSSFLSFLFLFFFIIGGFYMEWYYGKLVWLV